MISNILYTIKKKLRSITEYPLVEINDYISQKPIEQKINPIVHQTWIDKKFGKTHAKQIVNFRNLNKNLSFKIYNDQQMEDYMNKEWSRHPIYLIFKNALIGPLKTDIFRYCILYQQGGYYFDISRGCSVPLTHLHDKNSEGILTYEDTECFLPPKHEKIFKLKRPFNHFLQWGLGFKKNHKFLEILINEIVENYNFYRNKNFSNPKLAILNFTGPGMYTHVMRKYISQYGLEQLTELDIKFNGMGIFKLKGSSIRYYTKESYTYYKNLKICN